MSLYFCCFYFSFHLNSSCLFYFLLSLGSFVFTSLPYHLIPYLTPYTPFLIYPRSNPHLLLQINHKSMSVNTIPSTGGVSSLDLLPGETIRYKTSSFRQSLLLSLNDPRTNIKVNINVSDGSIYLTNRRFVFVTAFQGDVSSFVIDYYRLPALNFSHSLESPWFGPNYWKFRFYSPPDGSCNGFPKGEVFDGKIVFLDGGVFDFVKCIDEVINDSLNNGHTDEELPRYSETI